MVTTPVPLSPRMSRTWENMMNMMNMNRNMNMRV